MAGANFVEFVLCCYVANSLPLSSLIRPGDGKPIRRKAKGVRRRHYPTMTLESIKAFPVVGMVADDAFLFLWVPSTFLPVAFDVMAAWGFKYSSTAFCWVKRTRTDETFHFGNRYTTRKNIELCLLGRRGKPRRCARDVRELIISPLREHSRKPDEVYERIERYCAGPYLELFARQQHPGWTALGNETNRFAAQGARYE